MARQTIIIDIPIGSPVSSVNLNNIGKNLVYILDENTVFGGDKTFSDNILISGTLTASGLLTVADMTTTAGNTSWLMSQDGNSGRILIAGGDSAAAADGAFIVIEGRNYLGSGLGGDLVLQAFTGKSIKCESSVIMSSTLAVSGTLTVSGISTVADMTTTAGNTSWLFSQDGNLGRILIAGGDSAADADGAYVVIEGRNYTGSGLGGDISLKAFSGKSIVCNSPINITTAPPESTIISSVDGITLIPRGQYKLQLKAVVTNAAAGAYGMTVSIDTYFHGVWNLGSPLGSLTTEATFEGGISSGVWSTGSDKRMRVELTDFGGNLGAGEATLKLRRY